MVSIRSKRLSFLSTRRTLVLSSTSRSTEAAPRPSLRNTNPAIRGGHVAESSLENVSFEKRKRNVLRVRSCPGDRRYGDPSTGSD